MSPSSSEESATLTFMIHPPSNGSLFTWTLIEKQRGEKLMGRCGFNNPFNITLYCKGLDVIYSVPLSIIPLTLAGSSTSTEFTSKTSPLIGEYTSEAACTQAKERAKELLRYGDTTTTSIQCLAWSLCSGQPRKTDIIPTLTDSTTPKVSPFFTSDPASGSST